MSIRLDERRYVEELKRLVADFRMWKNPLVPLPENDGPGLLLGTMWEDYSRIEERDPKRIKVLTLRMVPERLTEDWLTSGMENA